MDDFKASCKTVGDTVCEKTSDAMKFAGDQTNKATGAISDAYTGTKDWVGGVASDTKSGAKDLQEKAGEKVDAVIE